MSLSSVKSFLFLHMNRYVSKLYKWSYVIWNNVFYYRPLLQTFTCWPLLTPQKNRPLSITALLAEHHLRSSHFALSSFFLSQFLQEMMRFIAPSLTGATLHSHACVVENKPINNVSEAYSLQSLRSQTIQYLLQ